MVGCCGRRQRAGRIEARCAFIRPLACRPCRPRAPAARRQDRKRERRTSGAAKLAALSRPSPRSRQIL